MQTSEKLSFNEYLDRLNNDARIKGWPRIKYHPNPFATGAYVELDKPVTCNVCGEKAMVLYEAGIYTEQQEPLSICHDCVVSGRAAKELACEFVEAADKLSGESAKEKYDLLMHRTPGYASWQGSVWRSCCGDYCELIGIADSFEELEMNGIYEKLMEDDTDMPDEVAELLSKDSMKRMTCSAYIFHCPTCGKLHAYADID